ncbi:MAG: 5-formyltetrahydrofolate cyclo-ligase [Paludibacter sp.]
MNREKNDAVYLEKQQIREHIKELKKQLSDFQVSEEANKVFDKIELMPEFQSYKTILIYWSTNDELPTHKIAKKWSETKIILLPSINGENLTLKKFSSDEQLKKGKLGISEPETNEIYNGIIDLVIVPGIAFDLVGNRLGRGKGYYDRFFSELKIPKWGVAFDFQLLPEIPVSENDIKMDKVFTASKLIESEK